jgi:AraC-like DNA-binding protein
MIITEQVGPFLFMFLTGILGLAVSIILFISHNEKSLGNRLLALSVLSISYVLLINASFLTNLYQLFPFTYRVFSFITFCIGPFSYLYVRTVLRQEYKLSKSDILFFVPALLGLINRIPFLLLNREEQIETINLINQNLKMVVLEPDGLFPPGYLAIFRVTMTLGFVIAQFMLLIEWKKKLTSNHFYLEQNAEMIQWLRMYTNLLLLSVSLLFIQTVLQVSSALHFEQIIILTMGFTNLITSIMLFARPKILYGMVGWMQEKIPIISLKDYNAIGDEKTEFNQNRLSLTLLEGKDYKHRIETFLNEDKSYLEPGFTINNLSKTLNIPVYQLSSFINQEYQKSFVQFINDQRFEYLLTMIEEDPAFKNYTIDYIGKKIGFNSRTSFIEFIKKRTGKTPSEFFRS